MLDTRRTLLALLLLVLAGGSWWLARNLTTTRATFDGHLRHDPDYIVEHFTATTMNERGERQYTLTAPRLVHYGDDESSDIEKPFLVKYNEDGLPIRSYADHGWMPRERDLVILTGNVRVTREHSAQRRGGTMRFDRMRMKLDKGDTGTNNKK